MCNWVTMLCRRKLTKHCNAKKNHKTKKTQCYFPSVYVVNRSIYVFVNCCLTGWILYLEIVQLRVIVRTRTVYLQGPGT